MFATLPPHLADQQDGEVWAKASNQLFAVRKFTVWWFIIIMRNAGFNQSADYFK